MAALEYLARARERLDAAERLLRDAADRQLSADEFVEASIMEIREAREILDVMGDDEGTE